MKKISILVNDGCENRRKSDVTMEEFAADMVNLHLGLDIKPEDVVVAEWHISGIKPSVYDCLITDEAWEKIHTALLEKDDSGKYDFYLNNLLQKCSEAYDVTVNRDNVDFKEGVIRFYLRRTFQDSGSCCVEGINELLDNFIEELNDNSEKPGTKRLVSMCESGYYDFIHAPAIIEVTVDCVNE